MAYKRREIKDITIYDSKKAYDGYTLIAPMWERNAWLINMKGQVVKKWSFDTMPGNHCVLLSNGNILWIGRGESKIKGFDGMATELVEKDWDGNEVWRYDDPYLNHDFARLKNGNTIINRYVKVPEKIANNIKGGLAKSEVDGSIWSCSFQEITKEREIVWEWNHYEHLNPAEDILCPLCPRSIWGYTNAIDVLPDGNILFTLRFLNTIAILDKKSGKIIWRGGPEYGLGHPHNPTFLENGNILVFDNGLHRIPPKGAPIALSEEEFSRVVEIDPKSNKIVWQYEDQLNYFYSPICGGAQKLENGNTLICETTKGRIFEVTQENEIVWEYLNPFLALRPAYWMFKESLVAWVFQAHRYSPDYNGLKDKDLDPEKFEWVVNRKKAKKEGKKKILERLKNLGY